MKKIAILIICLMAVLLNAEPDMSDDSSLKEQIEALREKINTLEEDKKHYVDKNTAMQYVKNSEAVEKIHNETGFALTIVVSIFGALITVVVLIFSFNFRQIAKSAADKEIKSAADKVEIEIANRVNKRVDDEIRKKSKEARKKLDKLDSYIMYMGEFKHRFYQTISIDIQKNEQSKLYYFGTELFHIEKIKNWFGPKELKKRLQDYSVMLNKEKDEKFCKYLAEADEWYREDDMDMPEKAYKDIMLAYQAAEDIQDDDSKKQLLQVIVLSNKANILFKMNRLDAVQGIYETLGKKYEKRLQFDSMGKNANGYEKLLRECLLYVYYNYCFVEDYIQSRELNNCRRSRNHQERYEKIKAHYSKIIELIEEASSEHYNDRIHLLLAKAYNRRAYMHQKEYQKIKWNKEENANKKLLQDAIAEYDILIKKFQRDKAEEIKDIVCRAKINRTIAKSDPLIADTNGLLSSLFELDEYQKFIRHYSIQTEGYDAQDMKGDKARLQAVVLAKRNYAYDLFTKGQSENAIEILDKLTKKYKFNEEEGIRIEFAKALLLQGYIYFQASRKVEAEQVYNKLVDRFRNSRDISIREIVFYALLNKARLLKAKTPLKDRNIEDGDIKYIKAFEDAVDYYEKSIGRIIDIRNSVSTAVGNYREAKIDFYDEFKILYLKCHNDEEKCEEYMAKIDFIVIDHFKNINYIDNDMLLQIYKNRCQDTKV